MKIRFVRKAIAGAEHLMNSPTSSSLAPDYKNIPETGRSNIGSERPRHKYIKREQVSPGKYKYSYDQADGSKAPSTKDNEMMIQEFQGAMQQDPYWKKFASQFRIRELNGIVDAMSRRGEDADLETFMQELERVKQVVGVKGSKYVPSSLAAREYKELFSTAASNPDEYNNKLQSSAKKQQFETGKKEDLDMTNLQASGIDEEQLKEYQQNPNKLKEIIGRMQNLYNNFTRG